MRASWIGLAAVMMVCLATVAWAADAKPAGMKPGEPKTGTVKSVDAAAKTFVMVREPRPLTFTVDDKTTFTLDGKEATFLAAVKPGFKVTVAYNRSGETRLATKVDAITAEAKP